MALLFWSCYIARPNSLKDFRDRSEPRLITVFVDLQFSGQKDDRNCRRILKTQGSCFFSNEPFENRTVMTILDQISGFDLISDDFPMAISGVRGLPRRHILGRRV